MELAMRFSPDAHGRGSAGVHKEQTCWRPRLNSRRECQSCPMRRRYREHWAGRPFEPARVDIHLLDDAEREHVSGLISADRCLASTCIYAHRYISPKSACQCTQIMAPSSPFQANFFRALELGQLKRTRRMMCWFL